MSVGPLADIPVEDAERLARFIFTKHNLRNLAGTITAKAGAFAPYSRVRMSVTRHRDLSEEEIWASGAEAAGKRELAEGRAFPLLGRADFLASAAREQNLEIVPHEIPYETPRNHADVIGWPPEKPAQMICALEIASRANYIANPSQPT